MRTMLAVVLLAGALAVQGVCQAPTIDQSLNMRGVSGARISPDGRWVVYQVGKTNWEDNAFQTELWVTRAEGAKPYRLTGGKKSSSQAAWSPDGARIAFTSDRDGKQQIYLIRPDGGEATRLTNVETGVNSFEWAPDGRQIAFTAADPEDKARKERKEKLGEFSWVEADYTYTHLWTAEVPAGGEEKVVEAKRLTEGSEFTVGSFAWSPDSQRVAFSAARNPDFSSTHTTDLYVLTVADRKTVKIVDTAGPDSGPVWSPDGREIAYHTANGREFFYHSNREIAVVPAAGGTPRVLTPKFDEQPSLNGWGPDGIYFSSLQKTTAHLFRLNPANQAVERVSAPSDAVFFGFSFTRDFSRAAFVYSRPNRYAEIGVSPVRRFEPVPVTAMADQYKDFRPATREVVQWKSTDGTPIEGVLIKPASFDASRKYPLLVVIHGGPTGIDFPTLGSDRTYPIEMFAAKGALILRPNYRGSAGYGEAFRSLNVRNLGVGDYQDVISGVDYLIEKGIVDRDRVGAMGWSQGGYISAYITTFSDRFKAVSVGAGISDWMTYYVNTDIPPFTRQYLRATPWDDPEIYRKTSPISYVKKAKTPTLIQHGEMDRRVPIPNAYQLYRALSDQGVPVKMAVYKGFGHGINKPKEQRAVMQQNLDWFSEWMWNEKPAEQKSEDKSQKTEDRSQK